MKKSINTKEDISELIGNTPLIDLWSITGKYNLPVRILAKLESFNPGGSIKDRTALAMLSAAATDIELDDDTVFIEPTSGNTGISLAMLTASMTNHLIIVMPENMSKERREMIAVYGAEIVLTPAEKGMAGAIEKAEELTKTITNSCILGQFSNSANPRIHYQTTGPELWRDSGGRIDILVAGVGTGGTISGAGKYLKEQNPDIKIIAVEPKGSPVLSKGIKGQHNIQGIGAGFVPDTLDQEIYDEVITVGDEDAILTAKDLVKETGIFVGVSSGAALWAAMEVGKRQENEGKTIAVILPDSGNRYFSIWGETE